MGIPVYWSLPPPSPSQAQLKPSLKHTRPTSSSIRRHPLASRTYRALYSDVVRRRSSSTPSAHSAPRDEDPDQPVNNNHEHGAEQNYVSPPIEFGSPEPEQVSGSAANSDNTFILNPPWESQESSGNPGMEALEPIPPPIMSSSSSSSSSSSRWAEGVPLIRHALEDWRTQLVNLEQTNAVQERADLEEQEPQREATADSDRVSNHAFGSNDILDYQDRMMTMDQANRDRLLPQRQPEHEEQRQQQETESDAESDAESDEESDADSNPFPPGSREHWQYYMMGQANVNRRRLEEGRRQEQEEQSQQAATAESGPVSGGHSLADYQHQTLILQQQSRRRLQEQEEQQQAAAAESNPDSNPPVSTFEDYDRQRIILEEQNRRRLQERRRREQEEQQQAAAAAESNPGSDPPVGSREFYERQLMILEQTNRRRLFREAEQRREAAEDDERRRTNEGGGGY